MIPSTPATFKAANVSKISALAPAATWVLFGVNATGLVGQLSLHALSDPYRAWICTNSFFAVSFPLASQSSLAAAYASLS